MRVAVVDLGTNSTRLLVADVEGKKVRELDRRTTVTRLGEGLEASGRLSDDAMARVADALAAYRERIDSLGAERVVAVATSAMRDAANGPDFRAEIERRFDIDARTISGDEEARLTFLGATAGHGQGDPGEAVGKCPARPGAHPSTFLVIDIGGGSTEYVTVDFHVSTRMGSVRHTERHLHADPPTAAELTALAEDARAIVEADVPARVRGRVEAGIAVAGTATSLAAIDQKLDPYDPDKVHGYRLSVGSCERIVAELGELTVAQRRELTGLHPDRAPSIVAGAAILLESMRAFGLSEIEVSETDILHGAALTAALK
jgi:exopolyphosphatase / guanosine-5'-triphosphate,3'-diphosphate pyrophosphatase